MNFNVYLDKGTGEKIRRAAKVFRRSRNSIVKEALEDWLGKHTHTQWPENFFNFSPEKDLPDFKTLREDLKDNINEDPLA